MTHNNSNTMNAKIIDVTGTEFEKKFNIVNIDTSLPNALRRIILSEIETYGFKNNSKDIVIKKNTTKYHNEFLMHRLSLIPLNITTDNFDVSNYKFVIDVKNNVNKTDFYVTSKNFEIYTKKNETEWELKAELQDKFFKKDDISKDYIYICKLFPFSSNDGEQLIVECFPSICSAQYYGGHTAVCKGITYPMINMQMSHLELERRLTEKNITDKKEIEIQTKLFYNTDAYRYYNKNERNEAYEFTFDIESVGILSVKSIFASAMEILILNLEKIKKNILSDAINFELSKETEYEAYDLKLINENHTLGYLIQSYLYNYYKDDDENSNQINNEENNTDYKLKYVGYDRGHPLEKITTLRCSLSDKTNKNTNKIGILKDMTIKTIDNIVLIVEDLSKQWNKLNKK